MPRASHRDRRSPSVFLAAVASTLLFLFATLAVGCADVAGPRPAPRPRADILCTVDGFCVPSDLRCTGTDMYCECDLAGHCCVRGTFCRIDNVPVGDGTDTLPRRLRLVAARGPNAGGSFTTLWGERTLQLQADAAPLRAAPTVTWALGAAPGTGPAAAPTPPPPGPFAAADMPRQTTTRWRLPHGSPLSARALAIQVVAELPAEGGAPALRDSTVVRQEEVDVLRQEYADFGIPVPHASEIRTPGEVAGATRFAWGQLNQGDYGRAVLTPLLLAKLNEFDARSKRALVLTSVFRNPAHHRFHMRVSGGFATAQLSQHQYGTAVDVSTGRDRDTWDRLHDLAKVLGACAEPLKIATVNHVHADWRASAPKCPPGW